MQNLYVKERTICYTDVDRTGRLSLLEIPKLLQDSLTEYFGSIDSSNDIVKEVNNAAWVITKTRVRINALPFWRGKLTLRTYPVAQKTIRVAVETAALDEEGRVAFIGAQDLCAIDLLTRKLKKISELNYPQNIETLESAFDFNFENSKINFDESNKVGERVVHWLETDYTEHTNNVSYFNYMVSALSGDFFDKNKVIGFEIQYLGESRDGDRLSLYRKTKGDRIDFLIKNGGAEIARAEMKFTVRETAED